MSAKIAEKIRKVLALAEGTDNEAEATVLMMKVEAMLDEHNMTLLDVETASEDDPIGTDAESQHHFIKDSWYKWTIVRAAKLYGCNVSWVKETKNKTVFSIHGRESGRITVQLMLPFIKKQIRTLARVYAKQEGISQAKAERYIGNALNDRIARLAWEREDREKEKVASGSRALVPVDLVQAQMEKYCGKLRLVGQKSAKTTEEAQGLAEQISLHRQTKNENQLRIE